MSESIEITFTPGCHGTDSCGEVVSKIRALPGVRRVFHATGKGNDSCCAMLNDIVKLADLVGAIKIIDGVDTVRSQAGFGFIKPLM